MKQADNKQFRNILLDDRVLAANVQVEHDKAVLWKRKYTSDERNSLKRAAVRNFKDDLAYASFSRMFKLADPLTVNKDATKFGSAIWADDEVTQLLAQYGLPPNSPLSVQCVELPHMTNVFEHVWALHKRDVRDKMRTTVGSAKSPPT